MLTPQRLLIAFRLAYASGVGLMLVLLFGPYQGLEQSLGMNDLTAHAIAFYLATLGLFAIAPTRRRDDLIFFVMAGALAVEVLQPATGRSMALSDFLAGVAGVLCAYLPGRVEWLRQAARRHPNLSFSEIRARDRRRRMKAAVAPTPHHEAQRMRETG
ncbi:hypothetical protein LTR94_025758 [Friedmanniomyces endolithicus]|nr:hypothetical protein LTR94_025758 [Friedmanniomyces endolithicus]